MVFGDTERSFTLIKKRSFTSFRMTRGMTMDKSAFRKEALDRIVPGQGAELLLRHAKIGP